MTAPVLDRPRVAIVDDLPDDLKETRVVVRAAGFEPVDIELDVDSVEKLVDRLADLKVFGVVFDHRLNQLGPVGFDGATGAAACYRRHIPAILRTSFKGPFDEISIRKQRRWLPSVLHRRSKADDIARAMRFTVDELHGVISRERRPQRSLVEIVDAVPDVSEPTLDVLIPAWSSDELVSIPTSVLGEHLLELSPPELRRRRYFADVNVWAPEADDLFFENIEEAEAPPEGFFAWEM